jgi:hypothetical protein
MRMRPMCLAERLSTPTTVSIGGLLTGDLDRVTGTTEVTLSDYVDEIMASGFPGLRGMADEARITALDSYIDRVVEHDLAEAGFVVRRPAALRLRLAPCLRRGHGDLRSVVFRSLTMVRCSATCSSRWLRSRSVLRPRPPGHRSHTFGLVTATTRWTSSWRAMTESRRSR